MQTEIEILKKHLKVDWILTGESGKAILAAMREYGSLQSGQQGIRWVKGSYNRLYQQVDSGVRTACFVDYDAKRDGSLMLRDICTIESSNWDFSARGICYGGAYGQKPTEGSFVNICESLNVEWLDESPAQQVGDDRWISVMKQQIDELSRVEGEIIEVKKIGKSGVSISFKNNAYWLRLDKQAQVTAE